MNKYLIFKFIFLFFSVNIFSQNIDYKPIDDLLSSGNFTEAYIQLTEKAEESKSDLKIIWRIGFVCFQLGESKTDKKEKISWYEKGESYTKPYIDINSENKRDRAEVIQWYSINYATKMKLLGFFGGEESMNVVPHLFKLMDKSIEIDPNYAGSYLFKARLHEDVPFFFGGNKNLMGINYLNAIKFAQENEKIVMLTWAVKGFYKRNWNIAKRKEEMKKAGITEKDYADYTDRQYSYVLLENAKKIFENKSEKTNIEKLIYQEILELFKKKY